MEGPAPTRAIPESGAAATAHDAPTNKHDGPVVVMEGALATPSQSRCVGPSGLSYTAKRRGGSVDSFPLDQSMYVYQRRQPPPRGH